MGSLIIQIANTRTRTSTGSTGGEYRAAGERYTSTASRISTVAA
jgi:hypothetical protein